MTAERPPDAQDAQKRQRVIRVGTSQVHHGWSVSLMSVELWDREFTANFRLHHAGEETLSPLLALTTRDDRGNEYRAELSGGSGGGGPDSEQWHHIYDFTPPLDPAARELRFEAQLQLIHDETNEHESVVERTEPGPWTFTVWLHQGE